MDIYRMVKSDAERRYTLGIVYEPDVPDTDREFAKAEDIEAAAWAYMERLQRVALAGAEVVKAAYANEEEGAVVEVDITDLDEELVKAVNPLDDEHRQLDVPLGTVVESYVAPVEFTMADGTLVRKGSWLMGVVWTDEMFTKIKKGERTGFSMYGHTGRMEA